MKKAHARSTRLVTRRQALEAGLVLGFGGAASAIAAARWWHPGSTSQGAAQAHLLDLTSRATVPTGEVQRFRSRPDLAPAAVLLDISQRGQDPGVILMDSHTGPSDQGPMIFDSSGQLVWFKPLSAGPRSAHRAMNVSVQTYRGQPVLTWFDGEVVFAHGQGDYVVMSSSYKEIARVRAGNGYLGDLHEFVLTPEGTAIFTCYGLAYGDLSSFGGKRRAPYFYGVAQEVDVATGKVLFQWRSDQHVALAESYAPIADYGNGPWDYFHINGICPTSDGHLLICARNTWAVYKVDRRNGRVLWRLGGKKGDFEMGPGARFAWQHDVNKQADGSVTVFDNGAGEYKSEAQSRALVLNVDEAARTATLQRQYLHPRRPLLAAALGNVQFLPGGHVFVGWGAQAAFTEYGADGAPLLDGRLAGEGVQSYRAFRSAWTGLPTEAPALAVEAHGEGLTVYASWNGATEVAKWLVLSGDHPSSLTAAGVARREGFETQIDLPRRHAFVAVAAIDGGGKQLARSRPVPTT